MGRMILGFAKRQGIDDDTGYDSITHIDSYKYSNNGAGYAQFITSAPSTAPTESTNVALNYSEHCPVTRKHELARRFRFSSLVLKDTISRVCKELNADAYVLTVVPEGSSNKLDVETLSSVDLPFDISSIKNGNRITTIVIEFRQRKDKEIAEGNTPCNCETVNAKLEDAMRAFELSEQQYEQARARKRQENRVQVLKSLGLGGEGTDYQQSIRLERAANMLGDAKATVYWGTTK